MVYLTTFKFQNFFLLCRYSSQQAYACTTAVMSIVGYIVGLGDRHGENILIDSTNGDSVHVDFSCLFNRVSFHLCTSSPHSTQ